MTLRTNLNSIIWKIVFLIAGLYTAGGVLPGIFNPEQGLLDFTNQIRNDESSEKEFNKFQALPVEGHLLTS